MYIEILEIISLEFHMNDLRDMIGLTTTVAARYKTKTVAVRNKTTTVAVCNKTTNCVTTARFESVRIAPDKLAAAEPKINLYVCS